MMHPVIYHYVKANMTEQRTNEPQQNIDHEALAEISKAILAIRFGSVEVIIQDGKVVQIERKEKIRLNPDQKKSQG